jgi:hypothetical protein
MSLSVSLMVVATNYPLYLQSHCSLHRTLWGYIKILYNKKVRDSNPSWGKRLYFFPKCLDGLWGPPSLLLNAYWGLFRGYSGRVMKLTTHTIYRQRLKTSGAIPLLPYTSSFHRQGKNYFLSFCRKILLTDFRAH